MRASARLNAVSKTSGRRQRRFAGQSRRRTFFGRLFDRSIASARVRINPTYVGPQNPTVNSPNPTVFFRPNNPTKSSLPYTKMRNCRTTKSNRQGPVRRSDWSPKCACTRGRGARIFYYFFCIYTGSLYCARQLNRRPSRECDPLIAQ